MDDRELNSILPIYFKIFISLVIVMVALTELHLGSTYLYSQSQESKKFDFRVELLYFPDTTRSQVSLKIVFDVPYNRLLFVKQDTLFIAQYEVTVEIRDKQNKLTGLKDLKRVVRVEGFRETLVTNKFATVIVTFGLAPGVYNVTVVGTDQQSKYSQTYNKSITLPDFSAGKVNVSSIAFLQKPPSIHLFRDNILPATREAFKNDFYAYVETVVDTPSTPVKLIYSLETQSKRKIAQGDTIIQNSNRVKQGWFKIPANALAIGTYYIVVRAQVGSSYKEISKSFAISASKFRAHEVNLSEAILPMKYIMEKDDWQRLVSAPDTLKTKLFKEFWKRRDPTPDTQENELFQEFYDRVKYANRFYSVGNFTGWQSDRGRVYIIYGPPNEIDQRTSGQGFTKKYEIWYYASVQKRFIFQEDVGIGFYRLVSIEPY
jgi:GWxTD domain-containing protein